MSSVASGSSNRAFESNRQDQAPKTKPPAGRPAVSGVWCEAELTARALRTSPTAGGETKVEKIKRVVQRVHRDSLSRARLGRKARSAARRSPPCGAIPPGRANKPRARLQSDSSCVARWAAVKANCQSSRPALLLICVCRADVPRTPSRPPTWIAQSSHQPIRFECNC